MQSSATPTTPTQPAVNPAVPTAGVVPPGEEEAGSPQDRHEQEIETDNMVIKAHELQLSSAFFDSIRKENEAEGQLLHSQYCKFMYQNLVGSTGMVRGQRFGIEELVKQVCPDYKQKRKSDKTLTILRTVAKVFLEELLQEIVEVRTQWGCELSPQVIREAFRRYEVSGRGLNGPGGVNQLI